MEQKLSFCCPVIESLSIYRREDHISFLVLLNFLLKYHLSLLYNTWRYLYHKISLSFIVVFQRNKIGSVFTTTATSTVWWSLNSILLSCERNVAHKIEFQNFIEICLRHIPQYVINYSDYIVQFFSHLAWSSKFRKYLNLCHHNVQI